MITDDVEAGRIFNNKARPGKKGVQALRTLAGWRARALRYCLEKRSGGQDILLCLMTEDGTVKY